MTTKGYFGQFGGSFVPEPIQALLDELEVTFEKYKDDPEFLVEFRHYLKDYSGRETPLYFAESLTEHLGGAKIYLKREDLNHLGSHKLNNVLEMCIRDRWSTYQGRFKFLSCHEREPTRQVSFREIRIASNRRY